MEASDAGPCAARRGRRLTAPPVPCARPAQHGTCWQECHCSNGGTCEHTSECVAFTCDDPKMRRRGSASECVADECTQVPRRRRQGPLGEGPCLWACARSLMPALHGGGPGQPARGRARTIVLVSPSRVGRARLRPCARVRCLLSSAGEARGRVVQEHAVGTILAKAPPHTGGHA